MTKILDATPKNLFSIRFSVLCAFFLGFLGLFSICSLSACSSPLTPVKQAFRNRENDYIIQTVVEPKNPITPTGLNPIALSPALSIPPGPSYYPAESKPVNLTPPTLKS